MSKYAPKPATCTGCPWAELDNGYAGGIGPSNAKLAIIAESAGSNEATQGVPLVGWTGAKLNEFLRNHGVQRREVYLDNIVRCMPPAGKKVKLPKDVVDFCTRAHLKPALELIQPNAILALGDYSLNYLTGKKSITKHRGSLLPSSPLSYITKVRPTFHPSYLVKGESAAVMWPFVDYDISRAIEDSKTSDYLAPVENYNVNPTIADIRAFMEMARSVGQCSIDIETSAGSWWNTAILCVGMYAHDQAISVPFLGFKGVEVWAPEDRVEILELVGNFLEDDGVQKLFQNGNYDVQVLEAYGFSVVNFWFDTMIAHHAIVSEKGVPHDLAFIASIYTNVPFYKDDVKGEDNFALLDPVVMRTYNCRDTLVTWQAAREMDKELDEYDVRSTFEQDMRMLRPMRRVQARGVLIDQDKLRKYRAQLDEEIAQALETVKQACGESFVTFTKGGRPTVTPANLKRLLFSDLKLEPIAFTPTREPKTDFDSLLMLADQTNKDIETLLRIILLWKKLDKMRGTYFDDFVLDSEGRIHTSYLIHVTPTGRLSSRGPNLQNIPDGMAKELFIPSPGYVFLERDYTQIELRILGIIANDPVLKQTFADGIDVHTQNASDLYNNVALDLVSYEQRHTAKTFIYGAVMYGGTAATIRRQLISTMLRKRKPGDPDVYIPSVKEIERLQSNYLALHPAITTFQATIEAEVKRERRLRTPLGRVRIFLGRTEDMVRAAYNFPIQGTAADIINPAFIALDERVLAPNGVALQVHDSLLFEVLESEAERYVELSREIMERPIRLNGEDHIFPTKCKIGYSWQDLKEVA